MMHIPDGFLDAKTATATAVLSVAALGVALQQAKTKMPSHRVPLLGLTAAFLFAAQMVNFPIVGGTSGHLVGAVLAAVLLGPGPALIAMSSVLIVQSLLFADGGVLALGANIFNMAVAGSFAGYTVFRFVHRIVPGERGLLLAAGFAAWCTSVLAATLCAGELAWSGTVSWSIGFPAMVNVHMLIGVGEGIITMLTLGAIVKARPDLLRDREVLHAAPAYTATLVYGALVTAGLVLFIAPFATTWPDGLERVALDLGFNARAVSGPLAASPWAEYTFPGVGSPVAATMFAGLGGSAVVFVLAYLFARLIVRPSRGALTSGG